MAAEGINLDRWSKCVRESGANSRAWRAIGKWLHVPSWTLPSDQAADYDRTSMEPETSSLPAPSSISANEAYDIAYASARATTDTNLLEVVEKEIIQRTLKESGGNQVKASAMLGITRATLRKRIDAHSIRY